MCSIYMQRLIKVLFQTLQALVATVFYVLPMALFGMQVYMLRADSAGRQYYPCAILAQTAALIRRARLLDSIGDCVPFHSVIPCTLDHNNFISQSALSSD